MVEIVDFIQQVRMVVDKTLTPSPWTTWTTHMDYPKMDYAAEV